VKGASANSPLFRRAHLDEQVEAWPLPQDLPHSAHTHCGSGGFENTVIVLIANPDNTNSAINIGYKNFFIYLPLCYNLFHVQCRPAGRSREDDYRLFLGTVRKIQEFHLFVNYFIPYIVRTGS